jgi:spermidine synthase
VTAPRWVVAGGTAPVTERSRSHIRECSQRPSREVVAQTRAPIFDWRLTTIVLLFFASGCAALIYEVAWFQLLQLVTGSSAISLAILLATFMGGMCCGSILAPHIGPRLNPLRLYAFLELVIVCCGMVSLNLATIVAASSRMIGGATTASAIVASLPLLAPTIAMGATLPIVTRYLVVSGARDSGPGLLYAANLVGGVVGALLAGFYLLRLFDANVAIWTAIAIDLVVAVVAAGAAGRGAAACQLIGSSSEDNRPSALNVYVAIGLSGMVALSAQLIWTRVLSLCFGATVYAFSLIAAAFLIGLGTGSLAATILGRKDTRRSRFLLAWCQILTCAAIVWSAHLLTEAIPYWPLGEAAGSSPWWAFRQDFFRSLIVVMPGATLWGASFPLAVASVGNSRLDPGRVVGNVCAANTAGAMIGALATVLALAPLGTQRLQQSLVIVAALSGGVVLASVQSANLKSQKNPFGWTEWVAVAVSVGILTADVSPLPDVLIAYGRHSAEWVATSRVADTGHVIYTGEGLNDFIAVSRSGLGDLNFHASGKVQASTTRQDMRLQLLLGHLSHLVPQKPRDALVVGCGAGITAGAISSGPGVERITIAELEPLVPAAASKYFRNFNNHVIEDPRVTIRLQDGRHFLATTNEKFDIITTDLVDPWVRGVAALFTSEFFELAKQHLRPGGVVTQFVQLYGMSPEAVKSEIATFVDAFPNTVIWGNPRDGEGYDLVLLGQLDPVRIDVDQLQVRWNMPQYAGVTASLHSVGIPSAVDLLATYVASASDLKPWLAGAAINRDRDLRLQYLAGLGIDRKENGPIYRDMLRHSTFPSLIFAGSPSSLEKLRQAIAKRADAPIH